VTDRAMSIDMTTPCETMPNDADHVRGWAEPGRSSVGLTEEGVVAESARGAVRASARCAARAERHPGDLVASLNRKGDVGESAFGGPPTSGRRAHGLGRPRRSVCDRGGASDRTPLSRTGRTRTIEIFHKDASGERSHILELGPDSSAQLPSTARPRPTWP
jgi:hypothetical protein